MVPSSKLRSFPSRILRKQGFWALLLATCTVSPRVSSGQTAPTPTTSAPDSTLSPYSKPNMNPEFESEQSLPRGGIGTPSLSTFPNTTTNFGQRPEVQPDSFYPPLDSDPQILSNSPGQASSMPTSQKKLGGKGFVHSFRCTRYFTYKGKAYDCDSAVAQDSEGFRQILKESPKALEMLDELQESRRKTVVTAYTGTFGLLMVATSGLSSKMFGDSKTPEGLKKRSDASRNIRYLGLGVFFGSLGYGAWTIYRNEKKLESAVIQFNNDFPDHPIQIGIEKKF